LCGHRDIGEVILCVNEGEGISEVLHREMLRAISDQMFAIQRFCNMDDAILGGRFIEE